MGFHILVRWHLYIELALCFCSHSGVILVFISWAGSSEGTQHKYKARMSAETVHHNSIYIYQLNNTHK